MIFMNSLRHDDVDIAALNIFEFRAKARRLVNKHQVKIIIIDYLQLMSGSGDRNSNRKEQGPASTVDGPL